MARRPTPTALKVVTGSKRARAEGKDQPKPSALPTGVPVWLPQKAVPHWPRLAKMLAKAKIATEADQVVIGVYATAFAEWLEAQEAIARLGVIVQSPTGYPIQNPWVAIANKAFERLHKTGVELGLTPAARTRVKTTGGDDEDPADPWQQLKSGAKRM
jgi:P27 family predicted phage terminase small subunit